MAAINGLLAGVTVAPAVLLTAGVAPPVAMPGGAGFGSAVLAVHVASRAHRLTRMKATVEALFPTGAGDAGTFKRGGRDR